MTSVDVYLEKQDLHTLSKKKKNLKQSSNARQVHTGRQHISEVFLEPDQFCAFASLS